MEINQRVELRRQDARGRVGELGELAVLDYLEARGYLILAKNWRTKLGELDIVCSFGDIFVVVEVKSRLALPGARRALFQSITERKKWRLRKLAELYLVLHARKRRFSAQRIDVIGVLVEPRTDRIIALEHIIAAL